MTWDESHVSVGGLLDATQIGLEFGKKSTFFGAWCIVKNALECEVDHAVSISHIVGASGWIEDPPFF